LFLRSAGEGRIGLRRTLRLSASLAAALLLASLVVLATVIGSVRSAAVAATRPNIIFVLTDDQDSTSLKYMPHLTQRVVTQGVTFNNTFAADNLCCPDRASMLTGKYAHNDSIYQNSVCSGPFKNKGLDRETFATWLHRAGYTTAYFGKYLNDYNSLSKPPGWDRWYAYNGNLVNPYPINDQGTQTHLNITQEQEADHLGRKSVEWLKDTSGSTTPRLLVLATHTPHSPAKVADRYVGTYSGLSLPKPPNFNERDVSDKPSVVRKKPLLTSSDVGAMQTDFRARMEALRSVDDAVNGILDELQAESQLSNTYVIYTSDNGWFWGQHRLTEKTFPYDEGARLPLVVSGPGVQAGARITHLVGAQDLAPTIADLASATRGGTQDGKSFVPLLARSRPSASTWRGRVLIESWTSQGKFYAFRSDQRMYAEHHETSTVEREHYDLGTDPYELRNDSRSLGSAALKRLHESLIALKNCSGSGCRAAEKN
jgi:N-acetylglucosamine-6-sulfatase